MGKSLSKWPAGAWPTPVYDFKPEMSEWWVDFFAWNGAFTRAEKLSTPWSATCRAAVRALIDGSQSPVTESDLAWRAAYAQACTQGYAAILTSHGPVHRANAPTNP